MCADYIIMSTDCAAVPIRVTRLCQSMSFSTLFDWLAELVESRDFGKGRLIIHPVNIYILIELAISTPTSEDRILAQILDLFAYQTCEHQPLSSSARNLPFSRSLSPKLRGINSERCYKCCLRY